MFAFLPLMFSSSLRTGSANPSSQVYPVPASGLTACSFTEHSSHDFGILVDHSRSSLKIV
jgi:hypothetical protein